MPAAALLVACTAAAYGLGWTADRWDWMPAVGLAYLLPITLLALRPRRVSALVLATAGSLSLLPLVWRGTQVGAPAGSVVTLGVLALVAPAWAALLDQRAHSRQEPDQLDTLTAMTSSWRA